MSVDKDYLLNSCIPFGLPYNYKNIKVYPIQIKDYYKWEKDCKILLIEKNYIGDIEIIQMSYLKFLLGLGLEDESIIKKLIEILHLVLRLDPDNYTVDLILEGEIKIAISPIKGEDIHSIIYITEQDFEDIKTIVCYQNIYGYDDRYVDPDIKRSVDEYQALKAKGVPTIPLEKKIGALAIKSNHSLEQIAELPIRSFFVMFDLMVEEIDYGILKQAELAGTVKFKEPIEHWIYKEEKDKYSEGFVDINDYKKQIM